MRCLKCWIDITGKTAIYTKSCNHAFCEKCGEKSFKKELACPLCDTVLPKDGIGELNLKPDSTDVKETSTLMFGFEPNQMCEVLQQGLQFWSKQRQNETIRYVQEIRKMKKHIEDSQLQNSDLSKTLEEERLKKKALQHENESLQRLVSELEARYAEKARSMRKLSELYSELRQVHKRLEIDLQHGHNSAEFEAEGVGRSEVQIQTLRRSENRMDRRGENREELEDEGNGIRARTDREGYKEGHRRYEKEHIARCSSTAGSSGPQERLFTIAPKQGPRPGFGHHGRRKNVVAKAGRRRERSENSETATDYEQVENRLTTRPSRTNRR